MPDETLQHSLIIKQKHTQNHSGNRGCAISKGYNRTHVWERGYNRIDVWQRVQKKYGEET